jgi:hypothetical protein
LGLSADSHDEINPSPGPLRKIIIVIIKGKTAHFEPLPSFDDYATLLQVITSLNYTTISIFTELGHQPCVQPST